MARLEAKTYETKVPGNSSLQESQRRKRLWTAIRPPCEALLKEAGIPESPGFSRGEVQHSYLRVIPQIVTGTLMRLKCKGVPTPL